MLWTKFPTLHTYVLAEHHRPNDSECLPALIKAIKFFHPVEFSYIYVREGDKVRKKESLTLLSERRPAKMVSPRL